MTPKHPLGPAQLVLLALLTACGPQEYDPHTPIGVHPEAVRTLGCLDVGVAVGTDSQIPRDHLLLALRVGNRCQRPEVFDAAALRVNAQTLEGGNVNLDLVDPRRELGPRHLDASALAVENIEIAGEEPADRLTEICFDLRAVAPEVERARPEPICLRRDAEGWSP